MLTGQLANGVIIGGMYALLALGFTLIFGLLDKLNFAHPEAFMFGGFIGVAAGAATGAHALWIGLPLAMVAGGLFGLLTELVSFRKFTGEEGKITASLSSVGSIRTGVPSAQASRASEASACRSIGASMTRTS